MTETLVDGTDFVIDMRPLPVLPEPIQSETAPSPLAEPLYVLLMVGSSLSWGAQPLQLWKSLMSGKILSGPALIVVERWMRMVLGLVAAKRRTPAIRTKMRIRARNNITPPNSENARIVSDQAYTGIKRDGGLSDMLGVNMRGR